MDDTQPTTSSQTGTFYFAYGSNLSPVQMSLRLRHSPSSSVPVGIARLDNHAWIICKRGYANVVALPRQQTSPRDASSTSSTSSSKSPSQEETPEISESSESSKSSKSVENVVWGVLYNMHPTDEARLDMYEGHNEARNPTPRPNTDPATKRIKSHLQDGWDYNKHYLPVTVTRWIRDPREYGLDITPDVNHDGTTSDRPPSVVSALVYVDEFRTEPGRIVREYIGRMNRGIEESVALGVPSVWVERVMRRFIPEGIYVDDHAYVGTDEGYVEGEEDEDEE
ncbi:hypothetical protein RBB50_006557 [Rhinocladiella similis]